ncbi:MAG: hypothetical protein QOK05_2802 [Chloroflexota bacterium]|jgi:hypothetical protein|nr:hypothetical protein [Chloroflexota bacterium]
MPPPDLFREVLLMQLRGSGALVREATHDMAGANWARSIVPGANPAGFIAWHMARAIDWAVQCGMRGIPEVATRDEFSALEPGLGIGVGLTLEEATALAARIEPETVATYSKTVVEASSEWLSAAPVEVLTARTGLAANQAKLAHYRTQAHLEEVHNLLDIPNWQLLMRPAGGHIRAHAGELELLGGVALT